MYLVRSAAANHQQRNCFEPDVPGDGWQLAGSNGRRLVPGAGRTALFGQLNRSCFDELIGQQRRDAVYYAAHCGAVADLSWPDRTAALYITISAKRKINCTSRWMLCYGEGTPLCIRPICRQMALALTLRLTQSAVKTRYYLQLKRG
jgi:hypothetical protein